MTAGRLSPYKADFLKAAIAGGALKFGSFELKSKRISPYFFNAGAFYRADLLQAISIAYAQTINQAVDSFGLEFDVIFGPAYKGIPLATLTAVNLAVLDQKYSSICYCFDRKEAKDHGEGGSFVGSPLDGKNVLIVDDVITDGTAKRDAISKIRHAGGIVVGVVVALDRMEMLSTPEGEDKPMPSAIGQLRREYNVPFLSILTLDDIIEGMKSVATEHDIQRVEEYRRRYKASD